MIPGKTYTPEDGLKAAWRYRWWILVPFVVISLGTAAVVWRLPNWYRSDTLILVVPQRVPEAYVKSTVTTRIEDRLQSISQQILSRTRLERIIQDFNLYTEDRRTGIMEDIVERMRKDIDLQIVKGDAFRVWYVGADPRTVMKVTERLASLFIDESLRDREVLAEGTNQFLESQLEDARRQLIEHEKKLEEYRRKFDGQLPSQVDSNMQAIRSTELQLQGLTESIGRDHDQKLLIERQIADIKASQTDDPAPAVSTRSADPMAPTTATAAQQLEAAKNSLASLQLRLKPEHPDVVRMKRVIRELEAKAEAESLQQPLSPSPGSSPVERVRQNRMNELIAARDNLNRRIAAMQSDETRLKQAIADYQTRVAAAPTRESELVELTRDYETLQKAYTTLLAKKEDSKIAANLERRQIGEQFKVLDPARMPERPFSPNRPFIDALGAAVGLGIGIAFVAFFEYRDTTLKTDFDVTFAIALPVLARVPAIVTTAELATKRRWRLMTLSAATAMLIIGTAVALIWKLRT